MDGDRRGDGRVLVRRGDPVRMAGGAAMSWPALDVAVGIGVVILAVGAMAGLIEIVVTWMQGDG